MLLSIRQHLTVFSMCGFLLLAGGCKLFQSDEQLVVSKIQQSSKLCSVEFVLTKLIIAKKEKDLIFHLIKLDEATFLAHSEATIKAGVDLSKLKAENVSIQNNRISLVLPPVEVLEFNYPPDKVQVVKEYTSADKFLNRITPSDLDDILRQAEMSIIDDLEYMGIRKPTETKTSSFLTAFLKSAGYDEVFVSFAPTTQPLMVSGGSTGKPDSTEKSERK